MAGSNNPLAVNCSQVPHCPKVTCCRHLLGSAWSAGRRCAPTAVQYGSRSGKFTRRTAGGLIRRSCSPVRTAKQPHSSYGVCVTMCQTWPDPTFKLPPPQASPKPAPALLQRGDLLVTGPGHLWLTGSSQQCACQCTQLGQEAAARCHSTPVPNLTLGNWLAPGNSHASHSLKPQPTPQYILHQLMPCPQAPSPTTWS